MIDEKFSLLCLTTSDINENLPFLKEAAKGSEVIVELGVRAIVSTWALLAARPKMMISVDIEHPSVHGADVMEVYEAATQAGIDWEFVQKSSLEIELPEHDFLFIDTLHTYDQLTKELERHSPKTRRFIAMHDTAIPGLPEMPQAVENFLKKHSEWALKEHRANNNGMTLLKRV